MMTVRVRPTTGVGTFAGLPTIWRVKTWRVNGRVCIGGETMACCTIGAVATWLMTAVCDTVCRGVVRGAVTVGATATARGALGATVLVMAANTGWLATRTATSAAPVTAPASPPRQRR